MNKNKVIRRGKKPLNIFASGGDLSTNLNAVTQQGSNLLENVIGMAKTTDTSSIDKTIDASKKSVADANVSGNTDLMQDWSNYTNLSNVSKRDMGYKGVGQVALGVGEGALAGAGTGAAAGTMFGGPAGTAVGAGVGAIVGGVSSLASGIFGDINASKKARRENARINEANAKNVLAFQDKANGLNLENELNMGANYSALGGNLILPKGKINTKKYPGTFVSDDITNLFANGGTIHINPANKGKFTATKKATGKTTEELTHSKNPLTRKRAQFALNARHFNHSYADGGDIITNKKNLNSRANSYKQRLEAVRGPMNNDYDYAGYYRKYPKQAEAMIKGDPKAHFTDEFKLPNHATFSDESIYSKQQGGSPYEGGHWDYSDGHDIFNVSDYNFSNNPNLGGYFNQTEPSSVPIYKGGVLLPEVTITGTKYANGGNLSRAEDYGSSKKPYPMVKPSDFAGGNRSYPIPTKANAIDALRLAGLHNRPDVKAKVYAKYPELKKGNKQLEGGPIKGGTQDVISFARGGHMNFKSPAAYKAWLAYGHATKVFEHTPGHQAVSVRGHAKNVQHGCGGKLFAYGGDFSNGITDINNGGTHEQNPNEGVQMGQDNNGTPNLVEQGEVKYGDYIYSNRLAPNSLLTKAAGLSKGSANRTFAKIADNISKESKERPYDPISQNGLKSGMAKLQTAQEALKSVEHAKVQSQYLQPVQDNRYDDGGTLYDFLTSNKMAPDYASRANLAKQYGITNYSGTKDQNIQLLSKLNEAKATQTTDKTMSLAQPINSTPINNPYLATSPMSMPNKDASIKDKSTNYLEYLRYAPVAGSIMNVATDLLGKTNKPDYSAVNDIYRGITPVKPTPIGNYLTYTPFDRNFYINKLNESSAATTRDIINQAGGNRATATAGLLNAGYNTENKLGDLARTAEEYNMANKARVEEFNRGTNLTNAQMDLSAQELNQKQNMEAGLAAAEVRQKAGAMSSTGRSADLTNLFTNLGNVGTEQYNRNWINWLANTGVLKANLNKEYTGNESNTKAKGGKIKVKKGYTYGW